MFVRATLLAVTLAGAACASRVEENRSTKDLTLIRQYQTVAQDPADEQPIIAEGGPLSASAPQDDKAGEPKAQIGEKSRWSPGMSLQGGEPEVKLKYKVKF